MTDNKYDKGDIIQFIHDLESGGHVTALIVDVEYVYHSYTGYVFYHVKILKGDCEHSCFSSYYLDIVTINYLGNVNSNNTLRVLYGI